MEKVIIFGSEGLLGGVLMKQFGTTYQTVGLDRKDIDVLDATAVRTRLIAEKPALVINATAYNSVDDAEKSPEAENLALQINGTAVGALAKICNELTISLVHFSSDYVFGGTSQTGYSENAATAPLSKYGLSKKMGETLLMQETNRFYLVRLSRMFGAPGTSAMSKKSFVDIMLDLVEKQGKTELKIVNDERCSPTYSVDLAKFVYTLVTEKKPYGIYHGANSGACTWYEFAQKIFDLKKLVVNVIPVTGAEFPRPAKRPHFSELLNTKTSPQRPWQEALQEYLGV